MNFIGEHMLRFLLGSIHCDSYWGAYALILIGEHVL